MTEHADFFNFRWWPRSHGGYCRTLILFNDEMITICKFLANRIFGGSSLLRLRRLSEKIYTLVQNNALGYIEDIRTFKANC